MGYNAELAGMTQLRGAALLVLLMLIAGQLVRRIQARWLIGLGFILSALAFFHVSYNIDLRVDFGTTAGYRIGSRLASHCSSSRSIPPLM